MKHIICCALLAGVLVSCHTSHKAAAGSANVLSPAEQKDGWKLLFDGTTLNGWHVFNHRPEVKVWKASEGALHTDSTVKGPHGDLVTDAEYENYHLKLEWKIAPKSNSGIIFNVQEDPRYKVTYVTGPEMQIIDNNGHPDAKNIKHRAGDLYDLISASQEVAKPVGEWNEAEIVQNSGKLVLVLNGVTVVSTFEGDGNWNQLVANSKFKSMSDFAKLNKGRIALQDHGDQVWFRNIRIKVL